MDQQNYTDISHLLEPQNSKGQSFHYGGPEAEPARQGVEQSAEQHIEVHEVVEHEPDAEAQEHVDVRPDTVKLPQDVQDAGVESTAQTDYPAYNKVQLPISDEKILQGKKAPINTSIRWLAEVCLYILKKAHIQLKIAHGKAVRIFKG